MENGPRHRVITSLNINRLNEEVAKLSSEVWKPIGEPALAAPLDLHRPPYWAQAMYLHDTVITTEVQTLKPPEQSVISKKFKRNGA